jgi:hypothetical protein
MTLPARSWLLLASALAVLAACNGEQSCPGPVHVDGGMTPLPAEIDDILERRCRPCHQDPTLMFAPMPLVSWEDLHAPRSESRPDEPVYESMGRRINDERAPMPPITFPQLSSDERSTLNGWIADCAPAAE